jgi:hypothetical protein
MSWGRESGTVLLLLGVILVCWRQCCKGVKSIAQGWQRDSLPQKHWVSRRAQGPCAKMRAGACMWTCKFWIR